MKVVHRPATVPLSKTKEASTVAAVVTEKKAPESKFTGAPQHAAVGKPEGTMTAPRVKATAHVEKTVFNGWLKVHQVQVELKRGGIETEVLQLNLLQRPGHDSTHVETIKLHGNGPPTIVYKEGDTRPAAALRGTSYVATGIVAGSLDHEGVDAEATALMEIAEEVGGKPLGRLVSLGDPMPTMPVTDGNGDVASSESDHYYVGVLAAEQGEIKGDGGGLEVVGLMKPVDVSVSDALKKLDSGGIRENARARVALSRGLDKVGFVPQLNAWVRDLPPALQKQFSNLGLGETFDPRTATTPAKQPEEPEEPAKAGAPPVLQNMHLAAKISSVDLGAPKLIELPNGAAMIDSKVKHLADDGTGKMVPVGRDMPVQTLHTDYDRLKLAQFYVDPKLGPMVKLELAERPILAAKAAMTGGTEAMQREDVSDVRVPLPHVTIENGKAVGAEGIEKLAASEAMAIAEGMQPGAKVSVLSAPSYASPGQSDLQYHFLAAEVPKGEGFVTVAEALRRCRSQGAGDANTEALLLRLADSLQWIPQLGMSVEHAKQVR